MSTFEGFSPELILFLKDLSSNNNRDWFNTHKDRYIKSAKEPMLRFIVAMGERFERISGSYSADPRSNGGSMFRIYRDTRFSKDKRPYKENIGCQFRHVAGKDAHAPGFYIHIQPGECFAGGGIWLPPTPILTKIRDAIDRKQDEWTAIKQFIEQCEHISYREGEKLKRPPKGYDADHPLVEDLKQKTFFGGRSFSEAELFSSRFIDSIEQTFSDLSPLMRFITEALSLSF
jgi:uncharacterized protein (TIGR02453 family)